MSLKKQTVRPRDCALAVGIPLTRHQFFADLARPNEKDYAIQIRSTNKRQDVDDEYYWHSVYGPIANVLLKICAEVKTLGVEVELAASLLDVTRLLREFQVVTVVAHWCPRSITPTDILDPHALLGGLRSPQNRVQQLLHEEVRVSAPALLLEDATQMPMPSLQDAISEILNRIVAEASALYERRDDDEEKVSERALERLTRVALEYGLPGMIAKGPAVELADGCHSVDSVVAAVPLTFTGLLDLTMCNSVILGEFIHKNRDQCRVAGNRYPSEAHVRFMLYKLAISELWRRPAPFMDVLTKLHTTPLERGRQMTSLRSVLQEYGSKPSLTIGRTSIEASESHRAPSRLTPRDKENLRNDLDRVKRDHNRYFLICVALVLVLFLVSVVVVLTNLGNPGLIKILMTGFGATAAGLITIMINLWRVKSITEVIIVLAINLTPETIQTVINILSKRL